MTYGWVTGTHANEPTTRYACKSCYFPGLGVILVGGTTDGTNAIHDGPTGGATAATYVWTGSWTKLTPVTDAIAGFGGALMYDAARNVAVWVPGFDATEIDGYSEFDGTTWTNHVGSTGLSSVWGCGAYDISRGKSVYYEGYPSPNTLELNTATHHWDAIATAHNPTSYGNGMVYDRINHKCVLWDGVAAATWTYDGTDWTHLTTAHNPTSSYQYPSMAFDVARGRTYLVPSNEFDGTDWASVTVSGSAGSTNSCCAYDESLYTLNQFEAVSFQSNVLQDPIPVVPVLTLNAQLQDVIGAAAGSVAVAGALSKTLDASIGTSAAGIAELPPINKYAGMLENLLPPGRIWHLVPDGVLTAVLAASADELGRLDARTVDLQNEADPATAVELMPNYERELDLPSTGTTAERQARIVARRVARQRYRPSDFQNALAPLLGVPAASVVIIERTHAQALSMGDDREIFRFFVYRDPLLPGSYFPESAQALIDAIKPSHTIGQLIANVSALYDDPNTLYDRDHLGA